MRQSVLFGWTLCLALLGAAACGGEDPTTPEDAGSVTDSGVLPASDGGESDADANDAGNDGGGDAGPTDRTDGAIPVLDPPPAPADPSDFVGANRFLFEGPGAVQTGVAPGAIPDERLAVVHGVVVDTAGALLSGVTVAINGRPEFGQTISRADGRWDLAVAGGGTSIVRFDRLGYVTLQRRFEVGWHADTWTDEVMMTALDSASTEIILAGATEPQVHEASMKNDADGDRHPVLLFRPGMSAMMEMPDGIMTPIDIFNVRSTEVTIGPDGMKAMPGDLPANIGYTFCDELTVDEAIVAGAKSVRFDPPVIQYVENFLSFPAGLSVPNGSYDRELGVWIGEPDGRVIALLSETNGEAAVDADGDGLEDSDGGAAIGIDAAERRVLADRYEAPVTIWRVPIAHFSPWDHNWPYGPPDDADPPPRRRRKRDDGEPDTCKKPGSTIRCREGAVSEEISIPGTDDLHWSSLNSAARRSIDGAPEIAITGPDFVPLLLRVEASVVAWGRRVEMTFPPTPNQVWRPEITEDAYGRPVSGLTTALITVKNVFRGQYRGAAGSGRSWGNYGDGTSIEGDRERVEVSLVRSYTQQIGAAPDRGDAGLGGWTVTTHHRLVRNLGFVDRGDGDRLPALIARTLHSLGFGGGVHPFEVVGQEVDAFSLASDGGALIADADGSVWVIGGVGSNASNAVRIRGGRALVTAMSFDVETSCPGTCGGNVDHYPDGRFVVTQRNSVHLFDPVTGATERIGGAGEVNPPPAEFEDGALATEVELFDTGSVAVSPEGDIFLAHKIRGRQAERLVKIDRSGRIFHVGGNDNADNNGCLVPANEGDRLAETCLDSVGELDFDRDGNLLMAVARFWGPQKYGALVKVRSDGRIEHLFGCTSEGCLANQPMGLANRADPTGTPTNGVLSFEARSDGRILVVGNFSPGGGVIYELDPAAGTFETIAGGAAATGNRAPGRPATATWISGNRSLTLSPLGPVLDLQDENGGTYVGLIDPPRGADRLASPDGDEVWIFDSAGRHLRTLDAITERLHREFSYDTGGRLVSFRDAENNVTTIERDGSGAPLAIVAPGGVRSTLSLDGDGNLAQVITPAGRTSAAEYSSAGLLERFTDARGGVHVLSYDNFARLTSDQGPDGVGATLGYLETDDALTVTHTTSGNAVSTFAEQAVSELGVKFTRTTPSGAQTTFDITGSSSPAVVETDANRTLISSLDPDPRFGLAAPVVRSIVRSPNQTVFGEARTTSGPIASPDVYTQTYTTPLGVATMTHTKATRTLDFGSSSGRAATVVLDALGRPETIRFPGLVDQTRTYDAAGNLTVMTEGAFVARYGYTPVGHIESITDPSGEVYTFERDADGLLVTLVDPALRRTQLGRDGMGDLTSLTLDDGTLHTLLRTDGGRLSSYVAPGGGATAFAYDGDGQLETTTLPGGRTITIARDGAGRPTSITTAEAIATMTYADPNVSSRRYDLLWTPTTGAAELLTTTYTQDQVTRLTYSSGAAQTMQASYTYYADTRLLRSLGLSGSGTRSYTFEYDDDGLVTRIAPPTRPLTFDRSGPLGGITSITSDRLSQTLRYDARGALLGRTTVVNGIPIYSYDVTRAPNGRIEQRVETIGAAPPTTSAFGYDAAGRLLSVTRDATLEETYGWDVRDNRISRTIAPGVPEPSTYAADDRITAPATQSADGQLATRGADTFTFGARGELLSATVAGSTATYGYDPLGRRVRRTVGAVTWRYFYANLEHDTQLTAMIDSTNQLWSFIYDDLGVLVAIDRANSRYYVATDQLGSPVVVADNNGVVVQALSYDAFGRIRSESAPTFDLPLGFAGGLRDETTGFLRFGVRDYDPESGRFATRDPILFRGDQSNLYTYVKGDPVRWIDPSGTFSVELGLCDGVCIDTKIAITKDGVSVCVGTGFGVGNTLDISPTDGLDPTNIGYFKAAGAVAVGPVQLGAEGELERYSCGPSFKAKGCIAGKCLSSEGEVPTADDFNYDGLSHKDIDSVLERLAPPAANTSDKQGKVKLSGSLMAFHCQSTVM